MLLYITAEDVFGSAPPEPRGPRPPRTIPATVAGLYDFGLHHHVRKAALVSWEGDALAPLPDWRLDRLAIRLALYARERLEVEPGGRVAVVGRMCWLWPVLDFAAMGFGVTPVGVEHDVGDEALAGILAEAAPRLVFATDEATAARLAGLRRAGRLARAIVAADGLPREEGLLPLDDLLAAAAVLDTAERAQAFRAYSRERVAPDDPALWHVDGRAAVRMRHRDAMLQVSGALRSRPAGEGDVAYVDAPRVTLAKRLALAASIGDGQATTALGREGRAGDDVATVRPHGIVASEAWPAALCDGRGPRWPGGFDRPWAARRVREAFGGRLRWMETTQPLDGVARRALECAGVALDVPHGL